MIAGRAAFLLTLVLGACASAPQTPSRHDRVVLLPGSDGRVGAIDVRQGTSEAVLDSAYASTGSAPEGALHVTRADEAAVRAEFADALAALPPAPLSFIVYFVFGSDELTPESRAAINPLLENAARRPAPEITVIGHADQTGAERVNDTLSLRRAQRVKALLVERGIEGNRINAVGRGSREPLVAGSEGVAEVRNRRVEINIR